MTLPSSTTSITSRESIKKSLESHDDKFTKLLSLIPSQYYIHPTDEEAENRYLNSKKRKSKEEKSILRKQSIAFKFDPNSKTTADLLLNKDKDMSIDTDTDNNSSKIPAHKKAKLNVPIPASQGSLNKNNSSILKNGSASPLPESIPPSKSLKSSTSSSINDLKSKLADKLASFRNKRNITGTNDTPLGQSKGDKRIQKEILEGDEGDEWEDDEGEAGEGGETEGEGPISRDALEAESRKRRGEMRDKRRKERKEQRKIEGKEGKKGKGKEVVKNVEDKNFSVAKTQLLVPQLSRETISYPSIALPSSSSKSSKPFSSNSNYNFNSTSTQSAFPQLSEEEQMKSTHFKKLTNPTQALAQLQKHNKHLENMDEEKREEAEQKERWAKALHRAEGGKVVDDEKTLKKAVKRVEKGKGKSGKEWAERKKQLAQSQAISIKKRNDNIASRNQAKKDKRLGIKKKDKKGQKDKGKKDFKKGKGGRPGFEGKKGGLSKVDGKGGKDGKGGAGGGKDGKGKGR